MSLSHETESKYESTPWMLDHDLTMDLALHPDRDRELDAMAECDSGATLEHAASPVSRRRADVDESTRRMKRRLSNKISAQVSRERKKQYLLTLEQENQALRAKVHALQDLVRTHQDVNRQLQLQNDFLVKQVQTRRPSPRATDRTDPPAASPRVEARHFTFLWPDSRTPESPSLQSSTSSAFASSSSSSSESVLAPSPAASPTRLLFAEHDALLPNVPSPHAQPLLSLAHPELPELDLLAPQSGSFYAERQNDPLLLAENAVVEGKPSTHVDSFCEPASFAEEEHSLQWNVSTASPQRPKQRASTSSTVRHVHQHTHVHKRVWPSALRRGRPAQSRVLNRALLGLLLLVVLLCLASAWTMLSTTRQLQTMMAAATQPQPLSWASSVPRLSETVPPVHTHPDAARAFEDMDVPAPQGVARVSRLLFDSLVFLCHLRSRVRGAHSMPKLH